MRITIDLDADVEARLRTLARERGVPLQVVINDVLRASSPRVSAEAPYVLPTRRLGIRPRVRVDRALPLAEGLEDLEIIRKLEPRP